jgi:gas vesicle protein
VTSASDPDQIRREIERTQANLSFDVDALAEKVTPSKIVERRVSRARNTAARWKDKVMGSNPISGSGGFTGAQRADGGGVREGLQGAADTVSDRASTAATTVSDRASSAATTVSDRASSAATTVSDAVQEAPHAARRQTQGNPLAAGLIAFGAGWLVSSLLPATRREQQLAGQAKDVAQETAQAVAPSVRQVAEEVKENLREPAQQAVESVKSTATDAGQTVADESKAAAGHVQDRAQDAASTVRGHASSS